jgi:Zn-dependent protease with chaperone function
MAIETALPRFDERAINAGTTIRFVLLVVLLLATIGLMALNVARNVLGGPLAGCSLAAGINLDQVDDLGIMVQRTTQWVPYRACVARFVPQPAWWIPVVCLVAVLAVAALLFRDLPAWKARSGRVVPLQAVDRGGEFTRTVAALAAEAGLDRVPAIVVDPVAVGSASAVVFGSSRRPVMCLDGGLLVRGGDRFRAVVLHEFAHIRNGDVTAAYATIALWRAFLTLAFVPYLAWNAVLVVRGPQSEFWASQEPADIRSLFLTLGLIALGYLARCDVLRTREIYADLAATRWGASHQAWKPDAGAPRRSFPKFVELWQAHPRRELRRQSLTDPVALFAVSALSMFLTGAAVMLIDADFQFFLGLYGQDSTWLGNTWIQQAPAMIAAALVAAPVSISLWRSVAHAVLTPGSTVPSGGRAGLWLGLGMVTGAVAAGQGTIAQGMARRPEIFVLVVLVCAAFGWWTTQNADLWITRWHGRTIRPAMLLCLTAGWLALTWWLTVWQVPGVEYATGWWPSPAGVRQILLSLPGPDTQPAVLAAISVARPLLDNVIYAPVTLLAVTAMWIVPLLAWVMRPVAAPPGWVRRMAGTSSEIRWQPERGLPSLWRVLRPGLLGGFACWLGVAGVQLYMHSSQPSAAERDGLYEQFYWAWLLVALVLPTAVAAGIGAGRSGRYRLLTALIAAETSVLTGLAGLVMLVSADGCVGPLDTLESSCGWRPGLILGGFHLTVNSAFVLGLASAVIAAAVRAPCRGQLPVRPVLAQLGLPARPAGMRPPARSAGPGAASIWRRWCVGLICVAAAAATVTDITWQVTQDTNSPSPVAVQAAFQAVAPATVAAPVSAQMRALQIQAWSDLGGRSLLQDYGLNVRRITTILQEGKTAPAVVRLMSHTQPECANIGKIAVQAGNYFRTPVPAEQPSWRKFITQAARGSLYCLQGIAQLKAGNIRTAGADLLTAVQSLDDANEALGRVHGARLAGPGHAAYLMS